MLGNSPVRTIPATTSVSESEMLGGLSSLWWFIMPRYSWRWDGKVTQIENQKPWTGSSLFLRIFLDLTQLRKLKLCFVQSFWNQKRCFISRCFTTPSFPSFTEPHLEQVKMRFWHISGACFVARDGTTTFKAQLAAASVFGRERLCTFFCPWHLGHLGWLWLWRKDPLWQVHIFLNMVQNDQLAALKLRETPPRLNHSYDSCFFGNFVPSNIEWVSCRLHMTREVGHWYLPCACKSCSYFQQMSWYNDRYN